jgi:hypothetical protein
MLTTFPDKVANLNLDANQQKPRPQGFSNTQTHDTKINWGKHIKVYSITTSIESK